MLTVIFAIGVALFARGEEAVSPSPALPTEAELAARVAIIPLSGDIDYGLHKSVERRVEEALAGGAKVLIFEMDTYGGRLDAGHEISDYINDIKNVAVPKSRFAAKKPKRGYCENGTSNNKTDSQQLEIWTKSQNHDFRDNGQSSACFRH